MGSGVRRMGGRLVGAAAGQPRCANERRFRGSVSSERPVRLGVDTPPRDRRCGSIVARGDRACASDRVSGPAQRISRRASTFVAAPGARLPARVAQPVRGIGGRTGVALDHNLCGRAGGDDPCDGAGGGHTALAHEVGDVRRARRLPGAVAGPRTRCTDRRGDPRARNRLVRRRSHRLAGSFLGIRPRVW